MKWRIATPAGGGQRRLRLIVLMNAVGNGLFFSISALYFTRIAGITTAELGIGLTAGGVCGAFASVWVGNLAERWGPQRLTMSIWIVQAVGMVGYLFVHSFVIFLPLVSLVVMLDRSAGAGYRVLLARVLVGEDRTRARSVLRSLANAGMGAGATLAGVVLEVGTRLAYSAAILADVATFLLAASLIAGFSTPERQSAAGQAGQAPGARSRRARSGVWGDGPFLAITFLSMVLTLQFGLLEIGLPLWVAGRTSAPHSTVAAALIVNTGLIALLQVRVSKGSEDLARAARLTRRSGILLAAACGVFALAAGVPAWLAVALVLAAACLQTFAEMFFSVGTMTLSYDLVPDGDSGTYHGVFQAGYVLGLLLAPVIITNSALRFGYWGWTLLACLFAVCGALVVPAGLAAARARAAPDSGRTGHGPAGPPGATVMTGSKKH
ncbi:MAG TPA: MFS transporter [Streptosporangiaceae bacterium]|nr:MFS transporter [Streptosporangiaceae bacterium]